MQLYLGVDGGQSSTTALVANNEGRVLGRGNDGPCNHVQSAAEGEAKFRRVIGGCVRQALEAAGLPMEGVRFAGAAFGFSGGPADKAALCREIVAAEKYLVTTDAQIALTGATAGGAGMILIAGTGTIALARNAAGRVARAGGWGYVFGDEGGAFDIARRALRACLRQHEGWGQATALLPALLQATGCQEANEMLHLFYKAEWPRARVAKLAPIVDKCAEAGDVAAQQVLKEAASWLVQYADGAKRQVCEARQTMSLSTIGGVWQSRLITEEFRRQAEEKGLQVRAAKLIPAAGALLEAMQLQGLQVELQDVPEQVK